MDAIELTKKLIRIESTDPGSWETEIGEFVCDYLETHGAKTETYEVEPGRNIVKGIVEGEKLHPALVFLCHMDTVVKGDGWTRNAFDAEVSDGKIWGRGSCDMKSGLASALTAFAEAAEAQKQKSDTGKRPGTQVFIGTVDEEADMKGSEAALEQGWIQKEDWVLDMEPTSGMIQMAHKGRTWFELSVDGVTAHASMPEKGADAIAGIAFMIAEIRKAMEQVPIHEELGRSTVTFGQISGGYSPYVVPDHSKVTIDLRLVPPMNTKEAEKIVQKAIQTGEEMIPGVKGSYKITGDRPPVETHMESGLMKTLQKSIKEVTGETPVVSAFTGYTDTAVVAGLTGNPNCMSYGPGNLAQAHKPDEYVEISDIERCVCVYRRLIQNYETFISD